MATYGDTKNRIADELGGRSDLLSNISGMSNSPIELAIQDAILLWRGVPFWFNEYRTASAFSTVAHQEFYTSSDWADIATIEHIDQLSIVISGSRYTLDARTEEELEDISFSPTSYGQPTDFAYYQSKIRLFPIPDAVYAVNVSGTKRYAALSASGDTNVWTTEAEPLIRAQAKEILYRDTLMDPVNARVQEIAKDAIAAALRGQTMQRAATRQIRASTF